MQQKDLRAGGQLQLDEVKIERFKRIDTVDLAISDINILVGANGSGKSSILQALHLASCLMRQADSIWPGGAMVSVSDLDYLPSDEYSRLGHGENWGNSTKSPSSKVSFRFRDDSTATTTAYLEMRAARNAGITVRGELPEQVRTQFRGDETFFSGFIPGISGIQNLEQKNSKRVVLKACSFGDSNVYLRNALNLLSPDELNRIETWLTPLLGAIKLKVKFDEATDFHIQAEAEINRMTIPLELLGTGYLQLIQIFCYILLFKPKILLVDEPDIHLHPSVQEKLAHSLLKIARAQGIKIVMSTHSPFIVRGAPAGTNVVWVSDGQITSANRTVVELALGWGAFGKKVIVISEDKDNKLLKKLISQWPEIERAVTILPGRGYTHLPTKEGARELRTSLGGMFKVLVHRDRDSLTDEEVVKLKDAYESEGIRLWLTDQSDIESEFCDPEFLAALTGEPESTCENWISEILKRNQIPMRDQFNSQRAAHNKELHKAGGSPTNDDVWATFQGCPLKGAKGKFVFDQLKDKVNAFSDNTFKEITNYPDEEIADYPELALSLKATLDDLLA